MVTTVLLLTAVDAAAPATRSGDAIPRLAYSTFAPFADVLAVGSDGSAYVAGAVYCGEPTEGAFQSCRPGRNGLDVMIAKLDPSGATLAWMAWLGGSGTDDAPSGIAVDQAGNVYVAGFARSGYFPTTPGALDRKRGGRTDAFVAKLDPTGSDLLYSTFLGGTNHEFASDLAVDQAGNVYLAGFTTSSDFPTTPGALERRRLDRTSSDAFVAKLDPSGSRLIYSTLLGGNASDGVTDIEIDGAGNAYVTGETESKNFPTTPAAPQRRCATCAPEKGGYSPDAFLAKLDPSGSRLHYGTFLGGDSVDQPNGLAVDRAGNAYVAGWTASSDFPTTKGAFDTSFDGGTAFVVKLNRAGTRLTFATALGGACSGCGGASGVALDSAGNAWVTGATTKSFPTTKGAFRPRFAGSGADAWPNAFLSKFNRSGSRLDYSTFLGPALGGGVALDPRGNVYASGTSSLESFPTTPGAYRTKGKGRDSDGFIVKFSAR